MVERPKLHLDRRLPGKSTSMTSTAGIRKCRRMKPETSFMRRRTQRAAMERDRASCIEAKGAIHVHLHVNFDKEDRLGEEQELSNFPQAYTPDGCNKEPTR